MIPQTELDRALARWKARKLGHDLPAEVEVEAVDVSVGSGMHGGGAGNEEPTRVAQAHYQAEVATPPAEVLLGEDDYEVKTHIDPRK